MGKIIKFDPNRRRSGRGGKDTRNWTRPEDYGVPPPPPSARRNKRASPPPPRLDLPVAPGANALRARVAVAVLILAAVLASLLGLS